MCLTKLIKVTAVVGVAVALVAGTVAATQDRQLTSKQMYEQSLKEAGQKPIWGEPVQKLPLPTAADIKKLETRIAELQAERLATARLEVESRTRQYEAGQGTIEFLLEAVIRLGRIEAEVAKDAIGRVAAYERALKAAKEIEEVQRAKFDAGRIPIQDLAQAQLTRAEIETALVKAKLDVARAGG